MRCNCFSKDSAKSWMEFVSGHELSAEGVLLAFLCQWHLTSWSSWNSLEPLRWPEDEPLAAAWSRVVWREESLAWKTKGLCWLLNSKAEHTGQIFFFCHRHSPKQWCNMKDYFHGTEGRIPTTEVVGNKLVQSYLQDWSGQWVDVSFLCDSIFWSLACR